MVRSKVYSRPQLERARATAWLNMRDHDGVCSSVVTLLVALEVAGSNPVIHPSNQVP